ncbi:thermonuclease family protein [Agrobacterium vitis]
MAPTVGGGIYLERTGGLDRVVALAFAPANDSLSGSFSICGDSRRVNCVVDGDIFWIQGEKIRVADIDTPELSPPRCAAERIKGEAAKVRLRVLLSAGPFLMSAGLRDEDRYGRKLRTVTRNGQPLGEIVVGEGLAHRWDGARRGWCDS